jgi:hypothetical protein
MVTRDPRTDQPIMRGDLNILSLATTPYKAGFRDWLRERAMRGGSKKNDDYRMPPMTDTERAAYLKLSRKTGEEKDEAGGSKDKSSK